MAHAVSGSKFDVRTIPESWIFLKDVPTIPFGTLYTNVEKVAALFETNRAALWKTIASLSPVTS
jgi:L-fuculose-phosphate aldolase